MAGFVGFLLLVLVLVVLFKVEAPRGQMIRQLREKSAQQGRICSHRCAAPNPRR